MKKLIDTISVLLFVAGSSYLLWCFYQYIVGERPKYQYFATTPAERILFFIAMCGIAYFVMRAINKRKNTGKTND